MEAKRLPATHGLLQRAFTVTKRTNDQQTSTNLTIPVWNKNWQREISTNSDITTVNLSSQLPTYALEPQKKFDFSRAQKHLQLELNRRCGKISRTIRYDPKLALDLVRDLAQQLRRVIKPDYLNFVRYKIIICVSIVQTAPSRQIHQSMSIASRCLWNQDTDRSITVKTNFGYDMIATATAFIVYTD
ncbi:unnamed protein product [Adineta steineri]|uniref:Uncharacterized protein n=1 Tax=Adineta steineri TaxID=433720 RepID=A0A813PMT7_9BILA|nr:unnamed protein product [Adineta steineri]CAF0824111.1 unnamed protein product [Adineta steineri]CAF0864611.1 unnamed protein product [Adineta steineri]